MLNIKVGLLPFYLELYDRSTPDRRKVVEDFYNNVADALRRRGLEVCTAPICRLAPEFNAAIARFEQMQVEALVTLHLAYSPSLESAAALKATRLPIIVLDTTPEHAFGPEQEPSKTMYNHGIHGVQDMCNLLARNGKPFVIEAGHWQKSDVLKRVARRAIAARMASALMRARVGLIGKPFRGMGDFVVPHVLLKRALGLTVVQGSGAAFQRAMQSVKGSAIEEELASDGRRFLAAEVDRTAHRRSVHVGLAVRQWIERERLTAWTVNFLDVCRKNGLCAVPFLEAGKTMARGIGYAGEGDVLTAAFTGAIMRAYPQTTFTEMFCPDWKGNTIYLSHMGEVNVDLLSGKARLHEISYKFSDADNPVKPVGCLRGGAALFVNLAPLAQDRFRLIVAPVVMQNARKSDRMKNSIHGWFRPEMPIADFLADYSRAAGTHHGVMAYGASLAAMTDLAQMMGWESVVIQ